MPAQEQRQSHSIVSYEQLLSFLQDPASYPHRPKSVRVIQTHASFVALAFPYVYKVKKAVNFGFLDFSTLEKRRFFCEREVTLNRRLCPQVYLGVVPISLKRGHLTFGEGDEVVEYAVKMRELSEGDMLSRRLERGDVHLEDMERVALALKDFYESQSPTVEVESWGRIERLRVSTDENFRQTEAFIGWSLSRPAFEAIRFYTDEFYARHAALFESRVREGWIRDCHGDLHTEHVHLSPQSLHIYDCVEFNDRLRYVDVASDAAFLAMDLDFNGRADLSRHFVACMAQALGDENMLRLMDFYKCYRAYVRGKVESLRSREREIPKAERAESRARAQRYFRLALQYAVAGSEPTAFIVMGRVGSGKSTLAQALADELGWEVLSSDRTRKALAGVPLRGRSDAAVRSALYSKTMTEKTYTALFENAARLLKQGHSVLLDATFSRRAHRDRLRKQLKRLGIAYRFIEAQVSDEVAKRRLAERNQKPDEVSDARLEDFAALNRLYEPPRELGSDRLLAINTAGASELTLTDVLKELARRHLCS